MDPPVSSPIEHVTRLAATDDPEPPLEVPGLRCVSYGLQKGPPKELREFGVPISPRFALARMIAPASRSRLTKVASRGGRSFAYAASIPPVVRISKVSYWSLIERTMPWSGPISLRFDAK